jgi:ribosomal protein L11 methyltransferase
LSRQAQELQEAYAPFVDLVVSDEQEGWILMTATARAA